MSELENPDRDSNLVKSSSETLTILLVRARILVTGVNRFVGELLRARAFFNATSQRLDWVISKKKRALKLQQELRDVRMNISTILSGRAM